MKQWSLLADALRGEIGDCLEKAHEHFRSHLFQKNSDVASEVAEFNSPDEAQKWAEAEMNRNTHFVVARIKRAGRHFLEARRTDGQINWIAVG